MSDGIACPSARDLRKAITAMLRGKEQSGAPEAVERVADLLRGLESAQHIAERNGMCIYWEHQALRRRG